MNHSERPPMKCILTRTRTKIWHNEADYDFSIYTLCKALKALSQRFVFDLAKSDLAYYYKQCLDGIEESEGKAGKYSKVRIIAI
jgi:hypothetical protein